MEKWSKHMNSHYRKEETQMTNIQKELIDTKEVKNKIILTRTYYQPSWPIIF